MLEHNTYMKLELSSALITFPSQDEGVQPCLLLTRFPRALVARKSVHKNEIENDFC